MKEIEIVCHKDKDGEVTFLTLDRIKGMFSDAMMDFLYYDRKEDSEIPMGLIEKFFKLYPDRLNELVDVMRDSMGLNDKKEKENGRND